MLKLNDGRSELWQWDTKRKLTVDADCSQVHFSNKVFGRSIDVDVIDGVVTIPDILLQTDKELTAWAFAGTAENGYTKISKTFMVNRRNKPADYVFTPTEQTALGEILERLDNLEAIQDPDAIKNAVDDYIQNNPIKVDEEDPTVPNWAKQPEKPKYTAQEVGALPDTTEIPAIPASLPNPHALTFTGAVTGSYDGSAPVSIEIPSGGGSGGWTTLLDVTLTEEVKQVDVDTSILLDKVSVFRMRYNLVGAASQESKGTLKASFLKPGLGYGLALVDDPAGSVPEANNTLSDGYATVLLLPNEGGHTFYTGGYRYPADTNKNAALNMAGKNDYMFSAFRFLASTMFGIGSTFKVEYLSLE